MVITTFDIGRIGFTSLELTVPAGAVVPNLPQAAASGHTALTTSVLLALLAAMTLRNVLQAQFFVTP